MTCFSGLRGATKEDLLDHLVMEGRLAAAAPGRLLGKPAYHALTYGWLMSGLARAVTGKGMRALIREELARPLGTEVYIWAGDSLKRRRESPRSSCRNTCPAIRPSTMR